LSKSSDDVERKYWNVEKGIFSTKGTRTVLRHISSTFQSLGKSIIFLLLFGYPVLLVYAGIAYGAVAFWGSLGASILLIGLALSKSGYARNFEGRKGNLVRGLAGLAIAFVVLIVFYLGLFNFGALMVPILLGIIVAAVAFAMVRSRF